MSANIIVKKCVLVEKKFSYRYGRKVIIVGTPLVVGVVGLVKSFSVNYWMLLVLEFLESAVGYGNASMVLCKYNMNITINSVVQPHILEPGSRPLFGSRDISSRKPLG